MGLGAPRMERDSLEVAWRADVCLGQPLLLPPLVLLLPLGEGRVHDVVHLRVVAVDVADLGVLDVDRGHGERRPLKTKRRSWFSTGWS